MKYGSFLIFFLLHQCFCISQSIISGKVTDTKGTSLISATVVATKTMSSGVINYTLSDNTGSYKLILSIKDDSFKIKVSYIGYQAIEIILPNQPLIHNFQLNEGTIQLKNFTVQRPPVFIKNDTVNYAVDKFMLKQDRVISDVIKKIPGIEVQDDGRILYQGNPLQKFYINGLDLLDGRYSLASNNLPAEAVKNIQIIEHDQPIKILDSLVFSNRASLNLQLKKFTKTGSAQLGVGGFPLLWDVNVTPMVFNRNFQSISSYQTNNTGKNLLNVAKVLTTNDLNDEPGQDGRSLLGIQSLVTPGLEEKLWLNNKSHLFTNNILYKFKNELQLKASMSYINDYQKQYDRTQTTILAPNANIEIAESKENIYNRNQLKGGMILEKNTKQIYFKNSFQIEASHNNSYGNLVNNKEFIFQKLGTKAVQLSNRLSMIKILGKQLINLTSSINYTVSPQNLRISPGPFDSALANNVSYERVIQNVEVKDLTVNNSAGFTKGIRQLTLTYRLGINYHHQQLNSDISTLNNNQLLVLGKNFTNDLSLEQLNIYTETAIQYQYKRLNIDFRIPVSLWTQHIDNVLLNSQHTETRSVIKPSISMLYKLSPYSEASAGSAYNQQFGEISQVYNAYILQSYRNLQRYNSTPSVTSRFTNYISLNYRNPVKLLFTSVMYNFIKIKNNLLLTSRYNADGSNTLESLLKDNFQEIHTVNVNASTIITALKTLIKASGSVRFGTAEQFINNVMSKSRNQMYTVSLNLDNNISKYVNFLYGTQISYLVSKANSKGQRNNYAQHSLTVNSFPFKNQMFTINIKLYNNSLSRSNTPGFANLLYRYTIPDKKIDIEASCTNLLNTKYYISVNAADFMVLQDMFQLRSRQMLLSVRFSF